MLVEVLDTPATFNVRWGAFELAAEPFCLLGRCWDPEVFSFWGF